MKKTYLLALILPVMLILSQKNDINGIWSNGTDTLEFSGGYYISNGVKIACRYTAGEILLVHEDGDKSRHPYMLSFDKNMLYFDLERYERVYQSGRERSIIGFFLENSPLCLS